MLPLGTTELTPFEAAAGREWLSANGIGGFASGSVAGACTRRYHALLVAALRPPLGRMTLLSKVDETVTVLDSHFDLSTNRYPGGVVFPDGWRYLSQFTPWPVPTWTYRMPGDTVLVKRVYLARGKNTVYVTYTLREAPGNVTLTLTPLVAWKDYHAEMHAWPGFPAAQGTEVGGYFVRPTEDAPMTLADDLRRTFLFEALSDDQMAWLLERATEVQAPAGEQILSFTEPADALYVLIEGRCR